MTQENDSLGSLTGILEKAIEGKARIAVLIDYGDLRVSVYQGCGDHPKEKARHLEKFSRELRKERP